MGNRTLGLLVACALGAAGTAPTTAQGQSTLRVVNHSDLKIIDPIWTTAYIVRNHGYMVWDTLFAMDEAMEVRPQMVDVWSLSEDRLTYSFTLRDGLKFHDGKPVTAEDCIASLKRWGARDSTGVKLMSFVSGFKAVDDKTFELVLKEPYGLVIDSLAKPGSSTPLIMPKRIADTDPGKQIEPRADHDPCRNTSTATREPDAVLLLQRASDHHHQARWFSATLNLLISLAAQPLVLVSVSLTTPDYELKRMRAPRDTAPAAAARAISADAPTQAELFT
jgi:ABC-type transport system substrate-binding protein